MKKIFFIAAIIMSFSAKAQVTKVNLQASGLTCSMCSNAIFKALKTLDFVDNVDANIKTSTFEITFKPNTKIDFDKLKGRVEGAGFSVAGFVATVHFDNVKATPGEPLNVGDYTFQFVKIPEQQLNGDKAIRIIDKGFVSAKEFKKNGVAIADSKDPRVYHVTI